MYCQEKSKPWCKVQVAWNGKNSDRETSSTFPVGAKHAWRNRSSKPMSTLTISTAKLGRALQEMGQLMSEGGSHILHKHGFSVSWKYSRYGSAAERKTQQSELKWLDAVYTASKAARE
jgi:hypothetical protein